MKKRRVRHYLIPHKKNGYVPRLLAEASVAVLFVIIVILFCFAVLGPALLDKALNTAAIYSGVLETLANNDRTGAHLAVLAVNPLLEKAAQAKADDMAAKGYFAHYAPDGTSPWYWMSKAGYEFSYAGENLAIDFSDSSDVNNAWLASPKHRENIMNENYTEIGVAYARGIYQGRETTFIVQMFGSPVNEPSVVAAKNGQVKTSALTSSGPVAVPIAVRNTNAAKATSSAATSSKTANVLGAEKTPDLVGAIVTNPKKDTTYSYIVLAIPILIALAGLILMGIKTKKHKTKNIMYGAGLIITIVIMLLIMNVYFGSATIL